MTRPSLSSPVCLFALALVVGCGTAPATPLPDSGRSDAGITVSTDGGAGRVDGGLAVAEACPLLNSRRCDFLARCGLIPAGTQAHAECVRELEVSWCGPLTWPSHVAKGTLKYDAQRAEACGQAFLSQDCAEWTVLPDSCTRFLLPRVPLGGECYGSYAECIDGVCRGSSCPRKCQPRALLDEVCTVDVDCRNGLYCRFPPFMSSVGQCTAFGNVGAACSDADRCAVGLQCVNEQCRALPAAGSVCLLGQCTDSSYCDGALDAGVCVTRKDEGERCSGDECQAALVCDLLSGLCVKRVLSSGDRCTLEQSCPAGETCLGVNATTAGLCDRPRAENEACAADGDCEDHLTCLGADGGSACQLRRMTGGACGSVQNCMTGTTCLDGACTPLPLPGESCATTRVCRWGLCRELANTDGGAVCGLLLTAGQPCNRGEECASGACSNGACVARCVP